MPPKKTSTSDSVLNLKEALQCEEVKDMFRDCIDYGRIEVLINTAIKTRVTKLETLLEEKCKIIDEMGTRIQELEQSADDQEQYSRRTSIRINGIVERSGEDVTSVISNLCQSIDCTPTINRAHRVGKPRTSEASAPRPILCQFVAYYDKANVMKNRPKLKNVQPGVFISEDLTRKRAKIMYEARKLKRTGKLHDVWSFDGRIAIKDLSNKIVPIRTEADLVQFR